MEVGASYRNDLEIQFFGLRRSGNHGVIAWIAQQYAEPIVFLNDVDPFKDPFTTFALGKIPNAVPERRLAPEATEELRTAHKNLLLISYEDLKLHELEGNALLPERAQWLGESRQVRRVLLLRGFYNWFASRIRLIEKRSEPGTDLTKRARSMVRMWIAYAREFAGETAYLGEGVERVSFTQWVKDDAYNTALLERLGIPVTNLPRAIVPTTGGGSSFGNTAFSNEEDVKSLFERWKHLLAPEYAGVRDVLKERHAEIDAYNQKIFGVEIPF